MLKLEKFYHISKIAPVWQSLIDSNPTLSPFQYLLYNQCIQRQIRFFSPKKKPVYFLFSKDNKPIIIAPMIESNHHKSLSMLEDITGCGKTDFIYHPDCTPSDFIQAIKLLNKHYSDIRLNLLSPCSSLTDALLHSPFAARVSSATSVEINFGSDYDLYIKNLSKNARQNIRTAYNRMNKDEAAYNLKIFHAKDVKSQDVKSLFSLYYRRRSTKYANGKLLSPISTFFASHFKHDSISLKKSDCSLYIALYINNQPAAVMLGFLDKNHNSFIVPRLAIEPDFAFFSPGVVLINEAVKYFIENTDIRTIDLTKGEEKYKYQMGGTPYFTYSLHI